MSSEELGFLPRQTTPPPLPSRWSSGSVDDDDDNPLWQSIVWWQSIVCGILDWLRSSLRSVKDVLIGRYSPIKEPLMAKARAQFAEVSDTVVPLLWATGVVEFRACFIFICVGLLLCGTTGLTAMLVKLGANVGLAVLCAYAMRTQRDLVAQLETLTHLQQRFEGLNNVKASFCGVQCCFSKMSWSYMCCIPAAIEVPQALLAAGAAIGRHTHSADVEVVVAGALLVTTCVGVVVSTLAFHKCVARGRSINRREGEWVFTTRSDFDLPNWAELPSLLFWLEVTHAADAAGAVVISATSLHLFASYEQEGRSELAEDESSMMHLGKSDRGVQFRTKVVYGTCLRLPLKVALLGFQWATYFQFGTLNEILTSLSLHSSILAGFWSIAKSLPDQMTNIRFWQHRSVKEEQNAKIARVLLINWTVAVVVLLSCTLALTAIVSCNVMSLCVAS